MMFQSRFLPKLAATLCTAFLITAGVSAVLAARETPGPSGERFLKPRAAAQKPVHDSAAAEMPVEGIVVKLQEGSRVRLRDGQLTVLPRTARDRRDLSATGLKGARVVEDVLALQAILDSDARVTGVGRLFSGLSEAYLAGWRKSGETASGEQLADLDLYYEVRVPRGSRLAEVESLIAMLNELPSVEIAYAETPAEPAGRLDGFMKATPNFQSLQGYLNAAPQGIDAIYAWTVNGGRGSNVKFVDMEYGWQTTHEDFPSPLFHYHTPNPPNSPKGRGHGTAAVGVVAAKNNNIGITGIASSATVGLESNWNENQGNTALSIALAAAAVGSGGVVMLELQTNPAALGYPVPSSCCPGWEGSCGWLPLEAKPADFDAIKNATTTGRTVVEPAGNGTVDFGSPVYGGIFSRAVRDSGAVLIGARESTTGNPACFTNWGSRVDVNAWGDSVVTLGCGTDDPATCGNLPGSGATEDFWYTNSFRGTSSATPIVAGAALSLQGASKARVPSQTLSPAEIRNRLMSNATWVFAGKYIGPMPNLRGAFGQLLNGNRVPVANANTFTMPRNTVKSIFFSQLLANDSDADGEALRVDAYDLVTQHGSNDFGHVSGFNYTPAPGFVGTDVFSYRIADARGLMAYGKVTIQVQ